MTASDRLRNANTAMQRKNRMALARAGWVTPPADTLTEEEAQELEGCEEVIENGLNIWYQVGEALLHIRDNRLYRASHKTFEEYLNERWGMSRSRAHRLIDASQVAANLLPIGNILANEAQARELVPFAPDEQRLIVEVGKEVFGDRKPTASDYKSLGTVLREVMSTGAIDDGTGEQIPVSAATVTHVKAAVIEETYERLQRQEAHIVESREKRTGVPAALLSSDSNEWYTPRPYLEAVRAVLGHVDIDPASNAEANQIVQATTFYDIRDDGLSHEWIGKVFLNPPYGRDGISNQERWSHRLIKQYESGVTTEAILLVNAVTDRAWFQPLWNYPICFTNHRVPFYRPGGVAGAQPVCGSVFVYFGENTQRFADVFCKFGAVVLSVIQGDFDGQR